MGRGLDGYLISVHWHCVALKARERRSLPVSGGYGEGETPLPFPNRAVKPLSADGTWPARAWESRTPPVYLQTAALRGGPSVVLRVAGDGMQPGRSGLRDRGSLSALAGLGSVAHTRALTLAPRRAPLQDQAPRRASRAA